LLCAAEVLEILLILAFGPQPFGMEDGERRTVPADALRGDDARAVRNRQVARIIVTLE